MADYSARPTQTSPTRRRQPWKGADSHMGGSVLFAGERAPDLPERAREYDHALRQSQTAAARRRRAGPGPGAGVGGSALLGAASVMVNQHAAADASAVFHPGMAQTAVLGDSAGSDTLPRAPAARDIRPEDVTPDEGVGSGLGESYVDGRRAAADGGVSVTQSLQEEEEGLEDGGVLGLLAQIYGTKGQAQGPARVL